MTKIRLLIAAALLSISLVCFVYAAPNGGGLTQKQKEAIQACQLRYGSCYGECGCSSATGTNSLAHLCCVACDNTFHNCMKDAGVGYMAPPTMTPRPVKGDPNPTPTPRKGPGGISGLPESNPTATPKKGPGKTGTSGIGHGSPTPTPTPPSLLNKKTSPSPSPHHHN